MSDYETGYDDDGNEILIKVTKSMLKERLETQKKTIEELSKSLSHKTRELRSAYKRADNADWCDRLKEVLGEGWITATDINVQVSSSYMDVTTSWDAYSVQIPSSPIPTVSVVFTGDEAVVRFAQFLKDSA